MPTLFRRDGTFVVVFKLVTVLLAPVVGVLFSATPHLQQIWCASFVGMTVTICRSFFPTSDLTFLDWFCDMDDWRLTRSGDEPEAKRRAVSPHEDTKLLKQAVTLVSKMTLRQELEIRELQAAVFRCFLLKEPNPLILAVKTAVSSFLEQAKQARNAGGGSKGPAGEVHAHAWAAVTEVAASQPSLDSLTKNVISTHQAAMTHPDMIASIIYLTKLKKAFNKGEYKLYLAVHPSHQDLLKAVVAGILATGAVEKRGTAPPSGMARELQSLVDTLVEVSG